MAGGLEESIRLLDLLGVFFNAILGGVLAHSFRFDAIGFVVLATLSGLGGGIVRDVLLQSGTPVALTDNWYMYTALIGAAVAFGIRVEGGLWNKIFPPIDALAIGLWATVGAQKALEVGLGAVAAILLGAITAVGGGFTRDVILRRTPEILGGNTLYATCAVVSAGAMVAFFYLEVPGVGSLVATAIGSALMLLARLRGWRLPAGRGWYPSGRERPRWGLRRRGGSTRKEMSRGVGHVSKKGASIERARIWSRRR